VEKPYDEQTRYCYVSVVNTALSKKYQISRRKELLAVNYGFTDRQTQAADSLIEKKEALSKMKMINPKLSMSLLAFAYGYSIKEICEATGAKQNAVLARIFQARKQLKQIR